MYPRSTEHFLGLEPEQIPLEVKRKTTLWDNAIDLYRFAAGMLPTEFREGTAATV